ncbi:hypothetical protein [Streptomyces sp. NPDC085540]|uniref:hypothetical protein n=1 Tax=Streptomyces sp. NPDC085540 TaxID=3365730 RepID=UPI0037D8C925
MRKAAQADAERRPRDGAEVKAFIEAIKDDRGEKLAAGAAYEGSGYVVVDELGRPFTTDELRREARWLMAEAGLRKVRLLRRPPRVPLVDGQQRRT